MAAWIPTTLATAVIVVSAAAPAVDAGPCAPKKSSRCVDAGSTVDLRSVPDITKQIANEEPLILKQKPAPEPAPPSYTGPIVGKTLGKQRPTVGYSWSLE